MGERERRFRINVIADRETYVKVLAVKRELEDRVIRGEIQLKTHQGSMVDWDDVIRYLMDKAERCDGKAEGRA